ncbi:hypothetical protein [Acinetobacter sp. YH16058]|uniref:hypothetical protein n=1 Tax=Acinetobacter sp. YH16058 TaxID=2601196 RepID=UPI00211EB935
MATAFQKIAISTALVMGCSFCPWAQAQSLNQCGNGPLMVGKKQVGMASYFAQNCSQSWKEQNIQMDFSYTQNIVNGILKLTPFTLQMAK